MPEEEKEAVEAKASEASGQATESVKEDAQESAADRKKRNDVEYNWAEARRKMQELERQNREMQEQLERVAKPQQNEVDELDKLADDDIITKAHARKLAEKLAEKVAQKVIREREAATVEERLQLKYQDFAEIVTRENIELLKQQEPELAMSLHSLAHDPHAQGVAAYKLLKKLGIKDQSMTPDKKKAIENSQKPVSVQAVSKASAIGNAHLFENGLTAEVKASLWKEMQECARRA